MINACCAAGASHRTSRPHLHKVLKAPLAGKVGLGPAVVHVEKRDVVACGMGAAVHMWGTRVQGQGTSPSSQANQLY